MMIVLYAKSVLGADAIRFFLGILMQTVPMCIFAFSQNAIRYLETGKDKSRI